jgi:DNA repair exonuclease SbcCD ATPase subunit
VPVARDPFVITHKAIAALTVRVQIDSVAKLKASLDSLASELKQQQKTEVEFKARCVKDLNANQKTVLKKTDEKEDLEALLEEQATHLKTLTEEITDAQAQIAETEVEVKKASQNRETQNAQFQSTVADQRATQDILKKALAKLESFYKTSKKEEFFQTGELQVPPAQFSAYNANAGSSPVIAMIESIIQDSSQLEHESVEGEKKAQAEYEKFVTDSNALIKTLSEGVVEKTKESASTKSKVADAKGDLESTKGEIEDLGKVEEDLHQECDFTLKNFEIRQTARAKEIEALYAAKAILSTGKVRS